jgi:RimJ/RimL family protein N-acetyltransferase
MERIFARVFEYNKPSMRALEKAGFELESIEKRAVFKHDAIWNDHVYVKLR